MEELVKSEADVFFVRTEAARIYGSEIFSENIFKEAERAACGERPRAL